MRAEKRGGDNDLLDLLEITVQVVRLRIALTIKGQVASTAWPFFLGGLGPPAHSLAFFSALNS